MLIPESFKLLLIPLPPMLCELAGYEGSTCYVMFYYLGSKATWDDGRSQQTFSFYGVWQPWIDHIAMRLHWLDADLGTDDSEPTHCLLADTRENQVYLALWSEAHQFCTAQHPPAQPLTQEQWQAIQQQLERQPQPSLEQLQELGMFEMFGPPRQAQEKATALTAWLDQFVTEALVRQYLELAQSEDLGVASQALMYLEWFKRAFSM